MAFNEPGAYSSPTAQRIIEAARTLIDERQFRNVTVSAVAMQSDVNDVTVYRVFGSRAGLAAACWAQNMLKLERGIRRDRSLLDGPIDRIVSHLRRLARVVAADRQVTYAMIQAVETASMEAETGMGSIDPRTIVPLLSLCTPLLEDAQRGDVVRDDLPAAELAAFLTNSLLVHFLTRPNDSAAKVSRFVVSVALDGLLVTPPRNRS